MIRFSVFFYTLLFFLIAATSTAQDRGPGPAEYTFGAGDVLEVLVFEEPKLSKTVVVRMDGRISLPLAGEFLASGNTPAALAGEIAVRLEKFIEEASVSVILLESHSRVYYILGQVQLPGEYTITQPVSVLQAIARAGGLLEWAKKSRIMVVSRPDLPEKIAHFDYDKFLDGAGQNLIVQPGDTIIVP